MRYILLAVFIFLKLAVAQNNPERNFYRSDTGIASFTSEAPLEIIKASSNELRGILDIDKNTFAFQLFTKSFVGFNSPLQQEHFYENYIESAKYPQASFSGKIVEKVDFNKTGEVKVRAKGILDIHGVKRERIIHVNIQKKVASISAFSEFKVNLDDHNIEVPKLVNQKIAENIDVTIQIEMIRINDQ